MKLWQIGMSLICMIGTAILPVQAAYPERPITFIIPFGPGGAVDKAATILKNFLHEKHAVDIHLEFRGGGGEAAIRELLQAKPDGYVFVFASLFATSYTLHQTQNGSSLAAFRAVVQISDMPLTLAVHSASPYRSFSDLAMASMRMPGMISFATPEIGSTQGLFLRLLARHVPSQRLQEVSYTSGFQATKALEEQRVTAAFGVLSNHREGMHAGRLRLIGVSSAQRLPSCPDVSTFAEELQDPECVMTAPHGLLASRQTPDDRIQTIAALIGEALADENVRIAFGKAGLSADFLPPNAFQQVMEKLFWRVGELLALEQ